MVKGLPLHVQTHLTVFAAGSTSLFLKETGGKKNPARNSTREQSASQKHPQMLFTENSQEQRATP